MIRRLSLTATVLTLGLAGCGSSSHNSSTSSGSASSGSGAANATQVALEPAQRAAITFTKDAGTAFTTFDRAILVPYQHGAFKPNSRGPRGRRQRLPSRSRRRSTRPPWRPRKAPSLQP